MARTKPIEGRVSPHSSSPRKGNDGLGTDLSKVSMLVRGTKFAHSAASSQTWQKLLLSRHSQR
jgi:hypothetical protein